MKYGKTERISGIVILLALLAIIVPWLMSDPAPREERPQPTFVIEQPVQVVRQNVPAPEMPSTITPLPASEPQEEQAVISTPIEAEPRQPDTGEVAPPSETVSVSQEPVEERQPDNDPIAELMASNSRTSSNASSTPSAPAATQQGEWAIQVGSFGDVSNAQRLSEQLSEEGFTTYRRERDNNLTTVYVGPYATSDDGEAAMALIKQRANVQGLLVRVRD